MANFRRVARMYSLTRRVADQWLQKHAVEDSGAGSQAGHFFDNPEKREVREFAESGAISNSPEVAMGAAEEGSVDETPAMAARDAEEAPPTPEEIAQEPGGQAVSTLNRFLVQTEEPVSGVPQSHEEVPKHP
jgi:hypothetical protein